MEVLVAPRLRPRRAQGLPELRVGEALGASRGGEPHGTIGVRQGPRDEPPRAFRVRPERGEEEATPLPGLGGVPAGGEDVLRLRGRREGDLPGARPRPVPLRVDPDGVRDRDRARRVLARSHERPERGPPLDEDARPRVARDGVLEPGLEAVAVAGLEGARDLAVHDEEDAVEGDPRGRANLDRDGDRAGPVGPRAGGDGSPHRGSLDLEAEERARRREERLRPHGGGDGGRIDRAGARRVEADVVPGVAGHVVVDRVAVGVPHRGLAPAPVEEAEPVVQDRVEVRPLHPVVRLQADPAPAGVPVEDLEGVEVEGEARLARGARHRVERLQPEVVELRVARMVHLDHRPEAGRARLEADRPEERVRVGLPVVDRRPGRVEGEGVEVPDLGRDLVPGDGRDRPLRPESAHGRPVVGDVVVVGRDRELDPLAEEGDQPLVQVRVAVPGIGERVEVEVAAHPSRRVDLVDEARGPFHRLPRLERDLRRRAAPLDPVRRVDRVPAGGDGERDGLPEGVGDVLPDGEHPARGVGRDEELGLLPVPVDEREAHRDRPARGVREGEPEVRDLPRPRGGEGFLGLPRRGIVRRDRRSEGETEERAERHLRGDGGDASLAPGRDSASGAFRGERPSPRGASSSRPEDGELLPFPVDAARLRRPLRR